MVATHKLDPEKNTPTILAQYYALDLGMKLNLALVQLRVAKLSLVNLYLLQF